MRRRTALLGGIAAAAAMTASTRAPARAPAPRPALQAERPGTIERRVPGAVQAVVVLHGLYHSPGRAEQQTRLTAVAERHGFDLVYAAGRSRSWNAGWCCGRAWRDGVDDVAYLRSVVIRLRDRGIREVYLAGFSNGGMLAYHYACAAVPDAPVDGIVVAGATYPYDEPCAYRGRIRHFHGLADRSVPYTGKSWSGTLGVPVPDSRRLVGLASQADLRITTLPGFGHHWPDAATRVLLDEFGLGRR